MRTQDPLSFNDGGLLVLRIKDPESSGIEYPVMGVSHQEIRFLTARWRTLNFTATINLSRVNKSFLALRIPIKEVKPLRLWTFQCLAESKFEY